MKKVYNKFLSKKFKVGEEFQNLNEIYNVVGKQNVNSHKTMTDWWRPDGDFTGLVYKPQMRNVHFKDGSYIVIDETGWDGYNEVGLIVEEIN